MTGFMTMIVNVLAKLMIYFLAVRSAQIALQAIKGHVIVEITISI